MVFENGLLMISEIWIVIVPKFFDHKIKDKMMQNNTYKYKIALQGIIPEHWLSQIEPTAVMYDHDTNDKPVTSFSIRVIDQSALRGILNRLWDMNIEIISINLTDETTQR